MRSQGDHREKGEEARRLQIVHDRGDAVVTVVVVGDVLAGGVKRADLW